MSPDTSSPSDSIANTSRILNNIESLLLNGHWNVSQFQDVAESIAFIQSLSKNFNNSGEVE